MYLCIQGHGRPFKVLDDDKKLDKKITTVNQTDTHLQCNSDDPERAIILMWCKIHFSSRLRYNLSLCLSNCFEETRNCGVTGHIG